MKKFLFVLFTITIASMCLGVLNLSEKKMIVDAPCPGGEIIAILDINSDGEKDGIVYSENDGTLFAITNMTENNGEVNITGILPENSITGTVLKCSFPQENIIRLWLSTHWGINLVSSLSYRDVNLQTHTISPENQVCNNVLVNNEIQLKPVDFNNDGEEEYIINTDDSLKVFSFDNGLIEVFSYPNLVNTTNFSVGKINQDDLPDIFLVHETEVVLLTNNGNFSFSSDNLTVNNGSSFPWDTVHFADCDSDMDTDIFLTIRDNNFQGSLRCYTNNAGSFTNNNDYNYDYSSIISQNDYCYIDVVQDMNNDGFADCIFKFLYENEDGFYDEDRVVLNSNPGFDFNNPYDIPEGKLVDLNEDNLPDIINTEYYIVININNSTNIVSFDEVNVANSAILNSSEPTYHFKDINNDNILDVIQNSTTNNEYCFWTSNPDTTFSKVTLSNNFPFPASSIMCIDLNSNQIPDIVYASNTGCLYSIPDILNETSDHNYQQISDSIAIHEVHDNHPMSYSLNQGYFSFSDINNDSYPDISFYRDERSYNVESGIEECDISQFIGIANPNSEILFNSYSTCYTMHFAEVTRPTLETCGLMDYDFDGDQEIFQVVSENMQLDTYWHEIDVYGNTVSISDTGIETGISGKDLQKGLFFDIDNDGDKDFIYSNYNYNLFCDSLFWIENSPGNNLNSQATLLFNTSNNSEIYSYGIADFNNDDQPDVIFVSSDNHTLNLSTMINSQNYSDLVNIYSNTSEDISFEIQDFDNDNDKDVIIAYYDYGTGNHRILLENDGNANFSTIDLQNNIANIYRIVDIDSDGDSDFLYLDAARGEIYWKENYTQVPNSDTSAPKFSANITNNPNPFNPSTNISFNIKEDTNVEITIYNLKGQKVKTLVDKKFEQGQHKIEWNGTDSASKSVGSGVYFYKVDYNGKTQAVKKCVMLK